MPTVTKKMLAQAIALKMGFGTNVDLEMADVVFEAMRETLIAGNRIEIRGFGVFTVKAVKAKPAARNPRTGEVVYVPARRRTHFKPGKEIQAVLHMPRGEE